MGTKKLLTVNTPEELQPQQRRHGIKQQKSEQNREEEKGVNDQKCKLWSSLKYQWNFLDLTATLLFRKRMGIWNGTFNLHFQVFRWKIWLVIGKEKELLYWHMVTIIIRTIAKPCEFLKISYFNFAPTVICSQTWRENEEPSLLFCSDNNSYKNRLTVSIMN